MRRLISLTRLLHHLPQTPKTLISPFLKTPILIPNLPFTAPPFPSRYLSYGRVNLVITESKTPRFETQEVEAPRKERWRSKKRLKVMRRRERERRREANRRDPRRVGDGRRRRGKFRDAEERLLWKIEKAKIKEAALVERLKKYEVPKLQGPVVEPCEITGEECFYLKKMAQKGSNYVPVGRRGVFGGVILNMHMHWKKHETVKVFFKQCKPGQLQEFADEIARLSGGIPIQMIGDDTIIFYRGKNYVQPESQIMSPIDTLSKKRALEKSKYEQSLETVRHFIAVSEKELELYYRHIALCGNPNKLKPETEIDHPMEQESGLDNSEDGDSGFSHSEYSSTGDEPSDCEDVAE
ncbi:putative CRM domain-containing protein [Drosera capensis]